MTPKLKAEQLIKAHSVYSEGGVDNDLQTIISSAKNCALITVNEILKEHNTYYDTIGEDLARTKYQYYQEVKKELEAMK